MPATSQRSLRIEFHPVARLAPEARNELWSLYARFVDAPRDVLEQSLSTCDEVIAYRDEKDGALQGMALLASYAAEHAGRRFRVVWTGSVVLAPEARGHAALERSGLWWTARARLRHPLSPLFWFFDTYSVRSYVLLPRGFHTFWPRFEVPLPTWEQGVIDMLARRHYGSRWSPEEGVIRRSGNKRLREPQPSRPSPHADFFRRINPGYAEGDMLPCLCPLDARNLTTLLGRTARFALGLR